MPAANLPAGTRPNAVAMAPRSLCIEVLGEHDVACVIAAVSRLCTAHGLPAVFTGHVATAASELANNLWMHSRRGGRVSLALSGEGAGRGVELRADDDGPGIADITRAMSEGYSTGGGLGCGLPGVQRLMDEFTIDSAAGRGTRVVARKWLTPRR
jgi:serine/threonine-protein kinase RsbT